MDDPASKINDYDNKQDLDVISLRERARTLSMEELDRDHAEICAEIDFLDSQIQCDLGNYSPVQLLAAQGKIAHFKQKAEILKIELDERLSEKERQRTENRGVPQGRPN
jgi:hypothetical protein